MGERGDRERGYGRHCPSNFYASREIKPIRDQAEPGTEENLIALTLDGII